MRSWTSRFGGRPWRVTPDGVVVRNEHGERLMRTAGEPVTMRTYLEHWGDTLQEVARSEQVPLSLILMTLATENGPARVRDGRLVYPEVYTEPNYTSDEETPHQVSVGPMHVLISTARAAMGADSIDREWLRVPANNLRVGATVIRQGKPRTEFNPPLVAAAYNAGGVYDASNRASRFHNPWHLRSWGDHLDRAAAWYGDACAVLAGTTDLELRLLDRVDQLGRVVIEEPGDGPFEVPLPRITPPVLPPVQGSPKRPPMERVGPIGR